MSWRKPSTPRHIHHYCEWFCEEVPVKNCVNGLLTRREGRQCCSCKNHLTDWVTSQFADGKWGPTNHVEF